VQSVQWANAEIQGVKVTVAGHPAILKSRDAERVAVDTNFRLCPGRHVSMRVGRDEPIVVAVWSASVVSIQEPGPLYRVELVSQLGDNSCGGAK